jgi:hypothetical protein
MSISSFVISTCELSWVVEMSPVSIANFVIFFQDNIEIIMFYLLPNFTQNLMLINCPKNHSLFFAIRHRNTHVLSVPQLPHNW